MGRAVRRQAVRVGIRARLVSVVMLPALAVLLLGAGLTRDARNEASRAEATSRDAQAVVTLGRLGSLLALEQGMAEGLVQMSEAGMDVRTLSLLFGFDLQDNVDRLSAGVVTALAELERLLGPQPELASLLAARAGSVGGSSPEAPGMAAIRERYGAAATAVADVRELVESRSRSFIETDGESAQALSRAVLAADALASWIASGSEMGRLLSITVRPDDAKAAAGDEVLLELGAAWRAEQASRASLQRHAGPALAAALAEQSSGMEDYQEVRDRALRLSGVLLPAPEMVTQADRLSVLAALGGDVFAAVGDTESLYRASVRDVDEAAAAMVAEAQAQARATTTFTGLLLGSCVVATLLVSWSILAPLRRVARRAGEVRDGDLHGASLGAVGPPEIAAIAATIDEMADNLRLLEGQAEALAAGRLYDPVLHTQVPGRLGMSFRGSIERLTEVTERLAEQARVDPMTGLPNRAAAVDRLQSLLAGPADVGVLFVDLDGFKAVNDSFGHAAGDKVLIEIARRLRLLMSGDSLVARLGGDEFLLLLPCVDEAAAAEVGATIIDAVSSPVVDGDHRYGVAASVGVAIGRGGDAHSLIRDADQATYKAKELGKGRVQFFDVELRRRMEEKALLQRQIREAIDEGQFELYVQPVFALDQVADGAAGGAAGEGRPLSTVTRDGWGTRITGGEALVRWNRPDVGLVLPGEFIPVAEESWLIVELGQFMLRRACTLLTKWQSAGVDLHLSVNVSGRHVVDGAFVRDVRGTLEATGADPRGLLLEITESHLLTDLDTAAEALRQLRRLGVRVALDDFGTGYASLSYLRQLPIDVMKIDRAYVKDVITDVSQAPILENLMRLAEILGLSVVAEGVETEAQLASLRAMGCTSVQGFLLGRPMQVEAFEQFAGIEAVLGSAPPRSSGSRRRPAAVPAQIDPRS
ncbi:MAG: EAL domain-containing protein [Acidimicrobiales bacterium]|nr:EAL domain-containing protein [Acidimicrobiales bacterium]